jgi:hypothetical protein
MVLIYDMNTGNIYEPECAKPLSDNGLNPLEPQVFPSPRLQQEESAVPTHKRELPPTLRGADIESFLISMKLEQN